MAWTEIVDYTVPANTTSVTLTNFGTITKDDFVRIETTITVSSETVVSMYPNNQTTSTNYWRQRLETDGAGTSVFASRVNDARISQNTGTANSTTYLKISENNKANYFSINNASNTSSGALRVQFHYVTSTIDFTSGITSLTFTGNNNINTGSRIQIYKLTAEKVVDLTTYSNSTQVDLTGFTMDKGSEYLLVSDIINNHSTITTNPRLFVNDNTTGTNYYAQRITGIGTAAQAARYNEPYFLQVNPNESGISYSHIKLSEIGAYTSQNYGIRGSGDTTPDLFNLFISSTAENITSITKLNLVASEGNGYGAGSRFQLYKLY